MAYSVRVERQGLATELRDCLDRAERMIVQLRRQNATEFLVLLDRTEECFSQLESSGLDVRPEQARWQSLQRKIRTDAKRIVRVMDSAGGLQNMRESSPSSSGMWWRLDQVVAAERRKLWNRLATASGVVAAVLVMVWALFEFVIPVDDNVVISSEALSSVRQLVFEGRWDESLVVIEEAKLHLTQPDAELLIWEAVVRDKLGQGELVDNTLEEAAALIAPDQQVSYWWTLGSAYAMAGNLERSRSIAESVVHQYPFDPQGYFLLGNVEELEGNRSLAIELFDKTFELAMDKNTQLAVIARVRMGTLLQQPVNMRPPDGGRAIDERGDDQ